MRPTLFAPFRGRGPVVFIRSCSGEESSRGGGAANCNFTAPEQYNKCINGYVAPPEREPKLARCGRGKSRTFTRHTESVKSFPRFREWSAEMLCRSMPLQRNVSQVHSRNLGKALLTDSVLWGRGLRECCLPEIRHVDGLHILVLSFMTMNVQRIEWGQFAFDLWRWPWPGTLNLLWP